MATEEERRAAAERLRAEIGWGMSWPGTQRLGVILGVEGMYETGWEGRFLGRLADLINPGCDASATHTDASATPDMSQICRDVVALDETEREIGAICRWCVRRLQDAGEAEERMLCAILSAVEDYLHPERAVARTARPVDREALMSMAGEMERMPQCDTCPKADQCCVTHDTCLDELLDHYARRIREACGEAS